MGLTSSYLVATSRWEEFLTTLRNAQAPERFTLTFLKDLGFTSSNERLFIPMLKSLGFLDESGAPTERYFEFLDDSRWQLVLADGIKDAYADLFQLNRNAQNMERTELIGRLKSLTRGQYSESVITNMARTFQALCELANFNQDTSTPATVEYRDEIDEDEAGETEESADHPPRLKTTSTAREDGQTARVGQNQTEQILGALTYRIEIVLPSTRDKAIYDAIFRSLREHFG